MQLLSAGCKKGAEGGNEQPFGDSSSSPPPLEKVLKAIPPATEAEREKGRALKFIPCPPPGFLQERREGRVKEN